MTAPYQVMPELTRDEYLALRADIEENGIAVPIIVDEAGVIIDGHHRAEIANALDMECPVEVVAGLSEAAKLDLALRVNINRRSLSREQKRELLAKAVKATPEQSNRQIAERVGVSHHTVGSVRDDLEATGQVAQLDERQGADGKTRPAKVTQTTRTTEATKIEREIDEATGEIVEPSPAVNDWIESSDELRRTSFNKAFFRDLKRAGELVMHQAEEIAELGDDDAIPEYEALIQDLQRHCQRAKALRGSHLAVVK